MFRRTVFFSLFFILMRTLRDQSTYFHCYFVRYFFSNILCVSTISTKLKCFKFKTTTNNLHSKNRHELNEIRRENPKNKNYVLQRFELDHSFPLYRLVLVSMGSYDQMLLSKVTNHIISKCMNNLWIS